MDRAAWRSRRGTSCRGEVERGETVAWPLSDISLRSRRQERLARDAQFCAEGFDGDFIGGTGCADVLTRGEIDWDRPEKWRTSRSASSSGRSRELRRVGDDFAQVRLPGFGCFRSGFAAAAEVSLRLECRGETRAGAVKPAAQGGGNALGRVMRR